MKTALIISIVVTGLLFFSTLVCGFWLRYSGQEVEASSLNFHMISAVLTAVATAGTIVLALARP